MAQNLLASWANTEVTRWRRLSITSVHPFRHRSAHSGGQGRALAARNAGLESTNRQLKLDLERLQRLAYLDPLTGPLNRRYFNTMVKSELQRAARTGKPLTLLIGDVDNFKHFNDTYGHEVGDALLVEIAGALRSCCRRGGDLAIRYAGDEFALLLPAVQRTAARFAVNVCAAVQAVAVRCRGKLLPVRVTLSIGGALFRGAEPCGAADLVAVADRALYRAKRAGRNWAVLNVCGPPVHTRS